MLHHIQNYNHNQQGGYEMHDIIMLECENYPSTKILKHVTILDKLVSCLATMVTDT